jgi:tRNA threonylcarbamoyladenosine biosynthesis protein TsaE
MKTNHRTQSGDPPEASLSPVISDSPEATEDIAAIISSVARPGDIFALEGTLSAGKTAFARGFARGLGIGEAVTSPSFPIIQEYDGTPPLFHMDLYRLGDSDEVIETGAQELWFGSGISLIEWPDRASDILPEHCIYLHFEIIGDTRRQIGIRGAAHRIEEIKRAIGR